MKKNHFFIHLKTDESGGRDSPAREREREKKIIEKGEEKEKEKKEVVEKRLKEKKVEEEEEEKFISGDDQYKTRVEDVASLSPLFSPAQFDRFPLLTNRY